MRTVFAGSLLSALVLIAAPLEAQRISADVHVAVVNGYSTYPPRRVTYYQAAPHVIMIERMHHHSHARHWERHGFRPVTVYYVNGRYYDRWNGPSRSLRRVVVYERNGRYYAPCDRDRHHGHDWND
jgi:hypothetical protein